MTTQSEIIEAARAKIGTPWLHQGRLPGVALDCIGLPICVTRELGLMPADFDVNGYSRWPDGTLLGYCKSNLIQLPGPELGALVVLVTQAEPQHVGFIAPYRHGGWSIIHATNAGQRQAVVETRFMPSPTMRPVGYFRFPGVIVEEGLN